MIYYPIFATLQKFFSFLLPIIANFFHFLFHLKTQLYFIQLRLLRTALFSVPWPEIENQFIFFRSAHIASLIFRSYLCRHGSSGCLSSWRTKPKPEPSVSLTEPPKRPLLNSARSSLRKPSSVSEDFWTSSAFDMDTSAVQSQGSISSISTVNHALDPPSNQLEFVNHGLLLWNQTRQRWIGKKRGENRPQKNAESKLSWNATYESLLGTNKPFPQPVPLPEMVDFLVDIWEQEGMYG